MIWAILDILIKEMLKSRDVHTYYTLVNPVKFPKMFHLKHTTVKEIVRSLSNKNATTLRLYFLDCNIIDNDSKRTCLPTFSSVIISFDKALCIYFFSRDAYVDLRISIKTHAEIRSH